MDPSAALARNAGIVFPTPQTSPQAEAGPAVAAGLLVDVVVLSNDMALFESARGAMAERNPVWRARSADEAASLLITGRCGVLLIDLLAVSVRADSLMVQISEQFPDVVICVAGMRDDEPLLVPMISDGLVYRFMHKPVSARRIGMFLQAAARHHLERRDGLAAQDPLPPLMRRLSRPPASLKWVYLATLLTAIGVVASYSVPNFADRNQADATVAIAGQRNPVARANPVLSRARAALAAGRYESPAGRNALDLFKAVLLEQPDHAEARAGLDASITNLLERARAEFSRGDRSEANRLVQRVLGADPQRQEALLLARQLDPPETPSRHLEREQIEAARVAAQALARKDSGIGAGAHASASFPGTAPERRSAPAPAPHLATPPAPFVPPTKALSVVATTAVAAQKVPAPPAVVRQPAQVMPDPLAPRYSNAPVARVASSSARIARDYGPPVSLQHEIAGFAREPLPSIAADPPVLPQHAFRDLRFVAADELDRIEARDPIYPRQALRDKIHGVVELEFTITEAGAVRDINIVDARPSGVFERAATEALSAWRFRPRYVHGQPTPHRSSITMHFAVDD